MIEPPSLPDCPDAGLPEPAPKPCARRLGSQRWCILPAEHTDPLSPSYSPDCHGVTPMEMPAPFAEIGPERKPRWSP
jgi:hypothetical protein